MKGKFFTQDFILIVVIQREPDPTFLVWLLYQQGGHIPGKLREFEKLSKSQGKLRENSRKF